MSIVVTGASGFIGSCLISELNKLGHDNIVAVDEFAIPLKFGNLRGKNIRQSIHRDLFPNWLESHANEVDLVYHLGARTDTTEFNQSIFDYLNLNYSKILWDICSRNEIPFIYASSAATYGLGEKGYVDNHSIVNQLKPLNPYGESKNNFDVWALEQQIKPPYWVGLKFFNVYGPNEFHKGRMASVVFHAYNQIQQTSGMKLFRSHNPDCEDGHQSRDFIYVKDVLNMTMFFATAQDSIESGLYNVGTGKARTFLDLVTATFEALGLEVNVSFIDTPLDIREKYQYFTEANLTKSIKAGYDKPFFDLEQGVKDYVQNYLIGHNYF